MPFVLLVLSLLICSASLSTLSYGHYHLPGPGFLPFWSGVLLGLLSLGLLFKSILQSKGRKVRSFRSPSNKLFQYRSEFIASITMSSICS